MNQNHSSLIVVSNRLPVSITSTQNCWKITPSSGGLASALTGVKHQIPFKWIGWPGDVYFPHQQPEIEKALKNEGLVPVFLNQDQEKHYYHALCNSYLWPLFHYFTEQVVYLAESWKYYEEVNSIFAEKVIQEADYGATIWIQDFHLMLLPEKIKKRRPDLKIGFFLHIPFPSSEIYRMLPKRKELLLGVLGSDYLGFHTTDYARHFKNSCLRILGLRSENNSLFHQSRKIGIGTHPIGMNIQAFEEVLQKPQYFSYIQEIKERYDSHQVVLGIERLDYTKGIFLKLQAFEELLQKNPDLVGKVILLQVIVPCRLDSPEYQKHRSDIEKMVSHINGQYSKPGFNPIHYMYRSLPLSELIALYCLANVCMVTSIRDGMNLVAQEFVYCAQRAHTNGSLILSEFTGAAHHLPHAHIVNPFDTEQMAYALKEALTTPRETRQNNLNKMKGFIEHLDSPRWAKNFLDELEKAYIKRNCTPHLNILQLEHITQKACGSNQRIIILDYDGTLREFTDYPMEATPTKEILNLLKGLCEIKNTEVHIVSGRSAKNLQAWFGHLPVYLSGEHGFFFKQPSSDKWKAQAEVDLNWMPYVKEVLEKIVQEVPGSFLEMKSCSIAWHYRLTEESYGVWRANELYSTLIHELANLPVEILPGKKVIEVRAQGVNKAKYVQSILKTESQNTFILCMGDDLTDHDMYKALPEGAVSIHVGEGNVQASFRIDTPSKTRDLLTQLYLELQRKEAFEALDQ